MEVGFPVTRLGKIAKLGIDRHQFHNNFKKADGAPEALPCLYCGSEEVRTTIEVEPNAGVLPVRESDTKLFEDFASRLLVPDRMWINTIHVVSVYAAEPVLSNMFYAVRLKQDNAEGRLKALCVWLNSTWGILSVLASRHETRGPWVELKLSHWRLLPVLDVTALRDETVSSLVKVFEKFKKVNMDRLPEQYYQMRRERLELDVAVLKALDPSVDTKRVELGLRKLYRELGQFLAEWIGSG